MGVQNYYRSNCMLMKRGEIEVKDFWYWERKFLGFSFTAGPEVRRVIAPKALDRFKQRIREITIRAKGVGMETTMAELAPYMRSWRGYFGFCETPDVLIGLTL